VLKGSEVEVGAGEATRARGVAAVQSGRVVAGEEVAVCEGSDAGTWMKGGNRAAMFVPAVLSIRLTGYVLRRQRSSALCVLSVARGSVEMAARQR